MGRKEVKVPRPLRIFSNSKVYHIILKGIDSQTIFYDDQDRNFFLKQISITKNEFNYIVYAYCLMVNHVHLVIKCEDIFLSKAMQSLLVRYVSYFNRKYKRTGPLMQNRFKSKNIEYEKYFIDLCRYVHRNPEKAGISLTQDYEWSSYKEYIGREKIFNKDILLYFFDNNINEFVKNTLKINDIEDMKEYVEYEMIDKLVDEKLIQYIIKKFNIDSVSDIPSFFKNKEKDELEKILKEISNIEGTNVTQVARITRLGRRCIDKMWEK